MLQEYYPEAFLNGAENYDGPKVMTDVKGSVFGKKRQASSRSARGHVRNG